MSFGIEAPRILYVTPEISYLPEGMGAMPHSLRARAGKLADVSASLIEALHVMGADIHVALPDYREIFNNNENALFQGRLRNNRSIIPVSKVHLAEDRMFFYQKEIYSTSNEENVSSSLTFQREVINTIVPLVRPDLIHCNDWMTGLIPAMARRLGIPCLFTIHDHYNGKALLSAIEDRGIDAGLFWENLFFERQPVTYEETRNTNRVDFLASGIFAAHFVNTACPELLDEILQGKHPRLDSSIQTELLHKVNQGCTPEKPDLPENAHSLQKDAVLIKNEDAKIQTAANYMDLYRRMLKRQFILN